MSRRPGVKTKLAASRSLAPFAKSHLLAAEYTLRKLRELRRRPFSEHVFISTESHSPQEVHDVRPSRNKRRIRW